MVKLVCTFCHKSRYEQQKIGLAQNYTIKKSAFFIKLGWYSTKIFNPWANHVTRISAWLDEHCRFLPIASPSFYCSYFTVQYFGFPPQLSANQLHIFFKLVTKNSKNVMTVKCLCPFKSNLLVSLIWGVAQSKLSMTMLISRGDEIDP